MSAVLGVFLIALLVASFSWRADLTGRLGALLVACGVLLFAVQNHLYNRWLEIARDSGVVNPRNQLVIIEKAEMEWAFKDFVVPAGEGSDELAKTLGKEALKQLTTLNFLMRIIELVFLACGTLVWGFGDLANCAYNNKGWTPC
ncbi:MAG: hypothetical protein QNJ09_10440 [Paracoccaceae bacterium]|nr:hypothetical protein [Paracoccaceae bacterium]